MSEIWYSKSKNKIECEEMGEPPTTIKKFRQSPELKAMYKFIYENNIRREFFQILNNLYKNKLKK